MVPVISSLIEDALLTSAVREEIENGVQKGKEIVKDQREAVKREAERWEQVRKRMETHVKHKPQILENRAKREYHKHKLASLDSSLKVLTPRYAPRCAPIGTDADSRVYWILSPGPSEREAASDFIMTCSREIKGKPGKSRKLPKVRVLATEEERKEMRSWSWFVAVWGRKPKEVAGIGAKGKERSVAMSGVKLKIKVNPIQGPRNNDAMDVDEEDEEMASLSDQEWSSSPSSASGSTSTSFSGERSDQQEEDEEDDDGDDDGNDVGFNNLDDYLEEENDDTERWWGFYDPFEIMKLSNWIAIKTGLDSEETDSNDRHSSSPKPKDLVSTVPLQLRHCNNQHDEVESRASSSTATLTGVIPGPGISPNGYGTYMNRHTGKKSRDTSVTIVNDPHNFQNKAQFKSLVEELQTFAGLLEWRMKEDKYENVLCDPVAASGGGGRLVSESVDTSPVLPGSERDEKSMIGKVRVKVRESIGTGDSVSSFY